MHVTTSTEKRWMEKYLETNLGYIEFDKEKRLSILERLTAAEGLEKYLARKYTGVKRFGLEGGESFIPAINEIRSEEHTSELQSRENLVCRLLLEKKKKTR